jgi:hypothetical protein
MSGWSRGWAGKQHLQVTALPVPPPTEFERTSWCVDPCNVSLPSVVLYAPPCAYLASPVKCSLRTAWKRAHLPGRRPSLLASHPPPFPRLRAACPRQDKKALLAAASKIAASARKEKEERDAKVQKVISGVEEAGRVPVSFGAHTTHTPPPADARPMCYLWLPPLPRLPRFRNWTKCRRAFGNSVSRSPPSEM